MVRTLASLVLPLPVTFVLDAPAPLEPRQQGFAALVPGPGLVVFLVVMTWWRCSPTPTR